MRPIRGMTPESAARVAFMGRQALDASSPSNVRWLNPVIIEHTLREGGANLWRGLLNLQQDALSAMP
jgi:polyhydroxyalkanoate synthase